MSTQQQTRRSGRRAATGPVDAQPAPQREATALATDTTEFPSRRQLRRQRAAAQQTTAQQATAQQATAQQAAAQRDAEQHATAAGATTATAAVRYDPTSADNLAMVTPLEFVRVPGLDRPVMRPPSTVQVPIVVTTRGGRRRGALRRAAAAVGLARPVADGGADGGTEPASTAVNHAEPIQAATAHGLDPLDAATAGLARRRRARLVAYGAVLVGAAALAAAIFLFLGGIGR